MMKIVKVVPNSELKGNPNGGDGYNIVEINVSNPAENIYAVCTPIKTK